MTIEDFVLVFNLDMPDPLAKYPINLEIQNAICQYIKVNVSLTFYLVQAPMAFLDRTQHLSSPQVYKVGMILPVLSAKALIGEKRYQFLLDEIAQVCLLPEEYFSALYIDLIDHFAEFVQLIPRQEKGMLGGLLNEGLVRGMAALQRYSNQFGQDSLDALHCYALFSACLFIDVSKAVTNQKVVLTDARGEYITQWRSFAAPMVGVGEGYKLYSTSSAYHRLDASLTPLLARQIMPESGFLWLASHWRVFADWLEALQGGGRKGGRLAHLISRILEEDLTEWFNLIEVPEIDPIEPDEENFADEFYEWLIDGIEDGSIDFNDKDSLVHVVDEGVFVDKQLFKQYADLINLPVNLNVVFTQFGNAVGIVNRGGDYDFQFKQYFSDVASGSKGVGFTSSLGQRGGRSMTGSVVDDVRLLFKGKDAPVTSAHVKSAQAIEVNAPDVSMAAGKTAGFRRK